MPWNNGESGGPAGSGGGGSGGGQGPWGNPGGNRPGGSRPGGPQGPWGGGPRGPGGGPTPPDLDDLITRAQGYVRGMLPPGFGGGGRGSGGGRFSGGRGAAIIAALVVLGWLGTGFYRVEPDEQGVVLRFGAFNRTTLPGLNYHIPWPVESVLTPAVTRINRVEIGYRSEAEPGAQLRQRGGGIDGVRDVSEESLMLTGDENILDINFAVFWRIRDAGAYLFNTRNAAYTVKSAAESVMREVIGRTPIQPAMTDARARVQSEVLKGVQAIMDQYKSGVEVTEVQLQKVDPPAAVIDSFLDVQRANTDAERIRNEAESYRNDVVPRARGEAARLVAEAEGARQTSIAQAGGEAQRFLSVLKAYEAAKDVTMQRLYIETMQDVLSHAQSIVVDNKLQGIVPFLPLNEAVPRPAPAPAAPPTPTPAPAAGARR
jgi:membrane protease subunit HflK